MKRNELFIFRYKQKMQKYFTIMTFFIKMKANLCRDVELQYFIAVKFAYIGLGYKETSPISTQFYLDIFQK